ncbi:MAG: thioredoxin family protein [Planctomycetota bacterium]
MKFATLLFAVTAAVLWTNLANAQQLDYKTAFQRAQKGDKPLLVFVSAQWCPPCQQMKKTTIPQLLQKDAFKECHWATVDLDAEKTLARQLIGDRGVPQLIMFEKRDGKWVRRYLRGFKDAPLVEAFVAQSKTIQISKLAKTTKTDDVKKVAAKKSPLEPLKK